MQVSPTQADVFDAVLPFIRSVVGDGIDVVQGLGNRVATPIVDDINKGFVAVTPLFRHRLRTNQDTWDPTDPLVTSYASEQGMQFDLQIDCYGPLSGDWAAMITTLWRDDIGCEAFGETCQPLYADDARQMPLIDSEDQYEERWLISAALQYNPVTSPTQQFANAVEVTLINVEERFPIPPLNSLDSSSTVVTSDTVSITADNEQ